MRTSVNTYKGHYSVPESETLIVSLAFEPDTGYLRVVHEPAEAVKPEIFHSFYLTFSPPGWVAMKAFYYNYKVNVTDQSIVVFQEKYLRGNLLRFPLKIPAELASQTGIFLQ